MNQHESSFEGTLQGESGKSSTADNTVPKADNINMMDYRWSDDTDTTDTDEEEDLEALMDATESDTDSLSGYAKIAPSNQEFGSATSITDVMQNTKLSDSSRTGSNTSLAEVQSEPNDVTYSPVTVKSEPVDSTSQDSEMPSMDSGFGSLAEEHKADDSATSFHPSPEGFMHPMFPFMGRGFRGRPFAWRGHFGGAHHQNQDSGECHYRRGDYDHHPEGRHHHHHGRHHHQHHPHHQDHHHGRHHHHHDHYHHHKPHHRHHHHRHHHRPPSAAEGHWHGQVQVKDEPNGGESSKSFSEPEHSSSDPPTDSPLDASKVGGSDLSEWPGLPWWGRGRFRGGFRPGMWHVLMRGMMCKGRGRFPAGWKWGNLEDAGWNEKAKCPLCDQEMSNRFSLRRHLRLVHSDKWDEVFPIKCENCDRRFRFPEQLAKHMERRHKHGGMFSLEIMCPLCSKTVQRRRQFNLHLYTHDEVTLRCEECKMGFLHEEGYERHKFRDKFREQKDNFKCDICGAEFKRKCNLYSHMSVHSDERNYSCHLCGQTFKHRFTIRNHMRNHLGIRRHVCELCNASFVRPGELKDHMLTHSDARDFKCDKCDKTFKTKHQMIKHSRTHTGEKDYVCSVCGESFTQSGHLTTHMRTHSGERPFKCPVDKCGISFSTSSSLKRHVTRKHDNIQPFKCDKCGQTFSGRRELRGHERDVHEKEAVKELKKKFTARLDDAVSESDSESDLPMAVTSASGTTEFLNSNISKDIMSDLLQEEVPQK